METEGHVVGMLDRDQRTAKIHIYRKQIFSWLIEESYGVSQHSVVPGRTSPKRSSRKQGCFWKSVYRLRYALILGACLSLVAFPVALAAPTDPLKQHPNMDAKKISTANRTQQKWISPCGGTPSPRADGDYYAPILRQANIADFQTATFLKEYVGKAFKMSVEEQHAHFPTQSYDWLQLKDIPKGYGQPVPEEHFKNVEFNSTLRLVYPILQTVAVALEQMMWDNDDSNGPFGKGLVETEGRLRVLLCEMHTAIVGRDLKIENVTYEVMAETYRSGSTTTKYLRNWVILRDYKTVLEYVIDVFNYLQGGDEKK